MTRHIHLAVQAETDLRDIMQFSEQRWGQRQRLAYAESLDDTFMILTEEPGIDRTRDEIAPGMKSHPTVSHVIYYLPLEAELLVVRVLHSRQDPALEEW